MKILAISTAIIISTAALAACGSSDNTPTATADATQAKPEIALSPIQEGSFERFNRAEFRENYAKIRKDLEAGDGKMVPSDPAARFSWLDRNGDKGLTPAEYAVFWANSAGSAAGADKLAAKGTLSDGDMETLLRTFYSFDMNGDSELSAEEFAMASGEKIDGNQPESASAGSTSAKS